MIHNALKKDAAKTANLTDKEKKKIEREKKRLGRPPERRKLQRCSNISPTHFQCSPNS